MRERLVLWYFRLVLTTQHAPIIDYQKIDTQHGPIKFWQNLTGKDLNIAAINQLIDADIFFDQFFLLEPR